ncbi:Uncharacterized protein DAT39_008113, partial [Clarias magur]
SMRLPSRDACAQSCRCLHSELIWHLIYLCMLNNNKSCHRDGILIGRKALERLTPSIA